MSWTYGKLDPEIKALWLEALESGVYRQGQRSMLRRGRYCCLGVLCDVTGNGYWESTKDDRGCDAFGVQEGRENEKSHVSLDLPVALTREFGLDICAKNRLVEMNDSGGSYDQIAQWIRENL